MKCYNHPDNDAVAQCRVCNKFLCKTCTDDSRDGICLTCFKEDEVSQAEYKRASRKRYVRECQKEFKNYRKNLIITGIAGIVFGLFLLLVYLPTARHGPFVYMVIPFLAGYLFTAVYSGYLILKWEMPELPGVWLFTQIKFLFAILFHLIKLPVAIIVGVFGTIPLYIRKRNKYLETVAE